METKANYVIIGAFTVICAVAVLLFGLFTAKYAASSAFNKYQVLFEQSVIGLSDGSPVLYNGVKIGRVSELQLNPSDVRQVLVTVEIEARVPVYQDTVATIRLTGLTGTAAVQLKGGSPDSVLLSANNKNPARITAVSSPLSRLLESSEGIVVTANKVLNQLDAVFSDANIERLNSTLNSLEQFSNSLAAPDSALNQLLSNSARASESLPQLLERLSTTSENFEQLIVGIDQGLVSDLPQLKSHLAGTLANLESLSGRLDSIVAGGQQQLSQFSGLGMNQLSGGLEDLRTLINDLTQLVQQLENNPAQLLQGSEQPEEYRSQ